MNDFNSQFHRQPDKDEDQKYDRPALTICGVIVALIIGLVIWVTLAGKW